MKKFLGLLLLLALTFSCRNEENNKLPNSDTAEDSDTTEFQEIIKDEYVLNKSTKNSNGVLVLFGGYAENAEGIKREFTILENAKDNDIAVLYMNYNRKLWFEGNELLELSDQLENIFKDNKLPTDNIYMGGFSSGGNMALLVSNFLTQQNSNSAPKGVFIVDSPLDLSELYATAKKGVERDVSGPADEESTWLIKMFSEKLGNPDKDISKYEAYSVFTSRSNTINNIKDLKNTKIRFYTEPDTIWWKEHAMSEYEEMNAYHIKKLSESLNKLDFKDVVYIPTKNKGYRSDGERHPHSWSIVDKNDLINWMLNK
ncbi:MAG: hypothetical protein ABI263_02375 [Gelidibacter sp.]